MISGKRIDEGCVYIDGNPVLVSAPARDGASVALCDTCVDNGPDVFAVYNLNSGGEILRNVWAAPFFSTDYDAALAVYNNRKLYNS